MKRKNFYLKITPIPGLLSLRSHYSVIETPLRRKKHGKGPYLSVLAKNRQELQEDIRIGCHRTIFSNGCIVMNPRGE